MTTNDIFTKPANASFDCKRFEQLYLASRRKENRLYTDGQVAQLPWIEPSHILFREWEVRKRSAARLVNYLENKKRPLSILEAGCGNGWLSGRLAAIRHSRITGTDINKTELHQAKSVFGKRSNIRFEEGDIRSMDFKEKFDAVIFAASIQYFCSFDKIIADVLSVLNESGEVHILDSYFYKANEIPGAKERTRAYFRSLGVEEMAAFYFHHAVDSLGSFNHTFLFDPRILKNKLFRKNDLFPWVCIKAK